MSKVICIYKYIILTRYVFWLTSCQTSLQLGASVLPPSFCALKKKKRKENEFPSITETDAVLLSLKPQSTLQRGEGEMAVPLVMHPVGTAEGAPLHEASMSD